MPTATMLGSSLMSWRTVSRMRSTVSGMCSSLTVVGQEDTVALEVEDRDLHQTAGELHADDVVFGAIEIQTDGTAVLVSVHVAGFFDDALRQQFRGDFGDCRRSELDGFGDLRA